MEVHLVGEGPELRIISEVLRGVIKTNTNLRIFEHQVGSWNYGKSELIKNFITQYSISAKSICEAPASASKHTTSQNFEDPHDNSPLHVVKDNPVSNDSPEICSLKLSIKDLHRQLKNISQQMENLCMTQKKSEDKEVIGDSLDNMEDSLKNIPVLIMKSVNRR